MNAAQTQRHQAQAWPKVGIVVLNWNGYEHTSRCLEALDRITYPNHQVTVVDNGSSDGSPERLRESFPNCSFVFNERNLGFSAGCNAGIRHALREKADFVLLLNNDAVLTPDALEPAVAEMERDRTVGLVGGKIYYQDKPRTLWYAGGTVSMLWGRAIVRGERRQDVGQYDDVCKVGFVTGAMMLISRSVLETVGVLREDYFLGTEEYDYCVTVRRAGYKLLYVPDFVAYHAAGGSHRGYTDPKFWYCIFRSRMIFQSRFHCKVFFWLWRWAFCVYWMTLARLRQSHIAKDALRAGRIALRIAIRDHRRAPVPKVTEADLDAFEREYQTLSTGRLGWEPGAMET